MSFSFTILGSGGAIPTSQRYLPAHVLKAHEQFFLIDCGEGTQIQLRKYRIRLARIHNIFISHLHGDHYFGLFGLLNTFNLLGRKKELNIFAPAGLEDILNHQIFFLEKLNFKIHFFHHENTVKGVVFENKKLCVEIFPLKHKIPTWGFMFREKPALPNIKKELVEKYKIPIPDIIKIKNGEDYLTKKGELLKHKNLVIPPSDPVSLAYCSDTMFNPDIIQYINKVNILYHEASFANEDEWRATDTQHSTGKQAALIAKQAKAGKLIIGHFSARYKNTDILLNECREIFPNTELAEEGRQFEI